MSVLFLEKWIDKQNYFIYYDCIIASFFEASALKKIITHSFATLRTRTLVLSSKIRNASLGFSSILPSEHIVNKTKKTKLDNSNKT